MDGAERAIDVDLALAQCERLHDLYLEFGHEVEFIEPVEGLPDMVFSTNGATIVDGIVLLAKFLHHERDAEAAAHREWFGGFESVSVDFSELLKAGGGPKCCTLELRGHALL